MTERWMVLEDQGKLCSSSMCKDSLTTDISSPHTATAFAISSEVFISFNECYLSMLSEIL